VIFYNDIYLLAARTTVTLLLGLWEEEEALVTTLDAVEVIVHVEETNRESHGGDSGAVHFAGSPGIGQEEADEGELDDGELGERWHHKTLLNSVNFVGGNRGILFHTLSAVTGHFYFMLRNKCGASCCCP
jgi:hypothetical protein